MENSGPLEEKLLMRRRTTTKRTGGSNFHYSALCAVGDRNGYVGVALGKSKEDIRAINKAKDKAKRNLMKVNITSDGTIPHDITIKKGAAKIILRPAPAGSGIMAGGVLRHILELAGVKNISAKIIGSNNAIMNAYALMDALTKLKVNKSLVAVKAD